jgi:hypothetical protein
MEATPYAPPKAHVDDVPVDSHGLKRRSVLLMIVFMFITLGIYYPVWWFRRRPGLNRLNSPNKLPLWPLLLMVAMFVIQFVLAFVAAGRPLADVIGEGGVGVELLFRLGVGVLMLVQTFRVKDIIEDHATPEFESGSILNERVTLSWPMTFFFSIFYLQWAINRYVVGSGRPSLHHH